MADDRFGFSTHFGSSGGWNLANMPMIAATGVGWIRDDLSWHASELTKGVYKVDQQDQGWIDAAAAHGLKVVCCLNANPIYDDHWDCAGAAAFCAWFAKFQGAKVGAIEVVNEPENVKDFQGTVGQAKYVTLYNAIHAAVKATGEATKVLGPGYQGDTILSLLPQLHPGGVSYHPYSDWYCPEKVWEPPYRDYAAWIHALRSKTLTPRWETEWGIGVSTKNNFTADHQANFLVRRLLQSAGLGIEHTFIYSWRDNGDTHGVYDNPGTLSAVERVIASLSGVYANPPAHATVRNGMSVYSYVFQGVTKTVCAIWIGGSLPSSPPPAQVCSFTFTVPTTNSAGAVIAIDVLTGGVMRLNSSLNWSKVGTVLTVTDQTLSDRPLIITVQ